MFDICVPDTQTSLQAEFFVVIPGTADTFDLNVLKIIASLNVLLMLTVSMTICQPSLSDTLLGRCLSEELGILKIGMFANFCESKTPTDKKASLKAKHPNVFTGLGKLKNFQLKLHVDETVPHVAQAKGRIPWRTLEIHCLTKDYEYPVTRLMQSCKTQGRKTSQSFKAS